MEKDNLSPWIREGALVDVLNDHNQWREALVVSVFNSTQVVVHFLYTSRDEDLKVNIARVRPYGSYCYIGNSTENIRVGIKVDVYDPLKQKFVVREIISSDRELQRVKLNHDFTNKWISMNHIFPYRHKTMENHPDHVLRRRLLASQRGQEDELVDDVLDKSSDDHYESKEEPDMDEDYSENMRDANRIPLMRKYSSTGDMLKPRERFHGLKNPEDERIKTYKQKLSELGYTVVPMIGDGNCLFRSISHQRSEPSKVYGTPDFHREVRKYCCDYMELENEYFQPFVEGDEEDFKQYIALKREDGAWGDDIEIQAMCELYNRPAQVFAYDQKHGAKQLRTFHESFCRLKTPMRLSFYGGGHYDSILGPGFYESLNSNVGELEESRLYYITHRDRNNLTKSQKINDNLLQESRNHYFQLETDIDEALKLSLLQAEEDERVALQAVMRDSIANADKEIAKLAIRESDIAATEEEELQHAMKLSDLESKRLADAENEELQRAIELSKKSEDLEEIEQHHLEHVLEISRGDATDKEHEDIELNRAIEESKRAAEHQHLLSEEEQLKWALENSVSGARATELSEDEELELAIQASLAKS